MGCGVVVVEVAAAAIDFYIDRDARLAFSTEIFLSQRRKNSHPKEMQSFCLFVCLLVGWLVLICYFVGLFGLPRHAYEVVSLRCFACELWLLGGLRY
ncbi:hypothetical protein T01_919 [Trichinella spiralis]|uniref:Uncharacterized protein n=1 Tax=Trichinella spiralis TaxID=6334 RepID=A0A0V1BSJ4_TRISP|nr:hypothetical protein T01_919 [Trichinella spiralis]